MINLCILNVNGIHGIEKRNMVVEWIKTQKCSIAFFTGNSFRWKYWKWNKKQNKFRYLL
jgi:hypothetical protein